MLWIGWLILFAIFLLIELNTGTFYFLLLSISSLIALGMVFVNTSFLVQCFVFVGSAFLMYVWLIPIIRKVIPTSTDTMPEIKERLIGQEAFVVQDIVRGEIGLVSVNGEIWSAVADESISKGEKVRIKGLGVTKLIVERSR
ncbi:NfeD family protein [Paenibacillus sp. MMO-58]|uniref:NfeD family protein n=1 Tax=Paenibacillus sp. MMO-58 TaxID=3081290 RepID=UPI0030194316